MPFIPKQNFSLEEVQFRYNHFPLATSVILWLLYVKVTNDKGLVSITVLLDLNAGFDTIDHDILLQRLEPFNWY